VRLVAALVLLHAQGPALVPVPDDAAARARPDVRAGLDTLYAGDFAAAARYFAALGAGDLADPAAPIFEAGAFIWWASALDSAEFERARIDSLLGLAIGRARAAGTAAEFWLATALGYRARERDLHGHTWGAARDGKAMRDAYRRVLTRDPTCTDCYLGLGVYHYGLARAPALAKLVAAIVGLGSGNADSAFAYLRRVSADGDLARVEAGWVLAAALVRDADRAKTPDRRAALRRDAREIVVDLAQRYPANPVFQRFLAEIPEAS
jgi:hypothetical protein